MESILCSTAQYDPERPLPPPAAAQNQVVMPNNVPLWPNVFPITGSSPKKRKRQFYEDQTKSHLYAYQRGHRCPGIVQLMCDSNGNPVKNKTCAQCNRGDGVVFAIASFTMQLPMQRFAEDNPFLSWLLQLAE